MSPPAADGMEQVTGGYRQLPSIPILQCRWGLGEGVSPTVFKPLTIPRHLLRAPDEPPPELVRRQRGRGRAAGLSGHDDPLPVPGDLNNVGVSNLTIREQIDRVRGVLPIYEPPTDYSQYILPRRPSFDDEEASEQEPPAAAPPPRQVVSQVTAGPSRRGGWAEVLDPGGEVAAVDSALLPQSMSGGGDAGLRALVRYNQCLADDSDDLDVLEERTNSSDMSNEWERPRAWRPRPPPLNEQSFPPLPGAAPASAPASAPAPAPARPAGQVPNRSPSKSDRSSSSLRSAAAGGDGPAAQPKKRGGRQGRKKPTAPDPPAAAPTTGPIAASAASPPRTSAPTSSLASDDSAAVGAGAAPAPPAEETPSGRVHVTGVTDSNWEEVQQYVRQYGNVEHPRRGSDDDGWFTVSPAENAGWIVSVHSSTPCDIPGVAFHLADDEAERHL